MTPNQDPQRPESPTPAPRTRPTEQMKRLRWLTEAQAALSWGFIVALVAVIGTVYLYQTSRIATAGRVVQGLQTELDDVKRENAALEQDIAEAQSLDRLRADAVRLGFIAAGAEDTEYLVVENYPASTPSLGMGDDATPTPTVEPIETITEAIWMTLRGSIGSLVQGETP